MGYGRSFACSPCLLPYSRFVISRPRKERNRLRLTFSAAISRETDVAPCRNDRPQLMLTDNERRRGSVCVRLMQGLLVPFFGFWVGFFASSDALCLILPFAGLFWSCMVLMALPCGSRLWASCGRT